MIFKHTQPHTHIHTHTHGNYYYSLRELVFHIFVRGRQPNEY